MARLKTRLTYAALAILAAAAMTIPVIAYAQGYNPDYHPEWHRDQYGQLRPPHEGEPGYREYREWQRKHEIEMGIARGRQIQRERDHAIHEEHVREHEEGIDRGDRIIGGRRECKQEAIEGAGASRPTEGWAKSTAIKRWRNEVIARFGKEFAEYQDASAVSDRCYHTESGMFTQCTIRAVPCRVDASR
jgi:hypothetical protein